MTAAAMMELIIVVRFAPMRYGIISFLLKYPLLYIGTMMPTESATLVVNKVMDAPRPKETHLFDSWNLRYFDRNFSSLKPLNDLSNSWRLTINSKIEDKNNSGAGIRPERNDVNGPNIKSRP